jgi:hypothetical protein
MRCISIIQWKGELGSKLNKILVAKKGLGRFASSATYLC